MKNLFCFNNAKTSKGEAFGWRTAILYLAPASLSGENVCKHSTAECRHLCLNTAGLAGVFKNIQESRIRKTKWMLENPAAFWQQVDREITNHENLTHRQQTRLKRKFRPCVRLNGTSDIWNSDMETIMHRHPDTQFYDYTKDPERMTAFIKRKLPRNYYLIYSFSGTPQSVKTADYVLGNGKNVAVVFDTPKGKPLPDLWHYTTVLDGDKHDLRFHESERAVETWSGIGADSPECEVFVIGLRAKGKAVGVVAHTDSFVQPSSNA